MLIDRVKQLDEQAARDALDLLALQRTLKSAQPEFAALFAKERKAVARLRARRVLEEPAAVYDDLIQKLKAQK